MAGNAWERATSEGWKCLEVVDAAVIDFGYSVFVSKYYFVCMDIAPIQLTCEVTSAPFYIELLLFTHNIYGWGT